MSQQVDKGRANKLNRMWTFDRLPQLGVPPPGRAAACRCEQRVRLSRYGCRALRPCLWISF